MHNSPAFWRTVVGAMFEPGALPLALFPAAFGQGRDFRNRGRTNIDALARLQRVLTN
jgi:hypothetical protein